jgi:hypothetical protein
MLIQRNEPVGDDAAIRPRLASPDRDNLKFQPQAVAGADWLQPAQFVDAHAQRARRRPVVAVRDQQPHGQAGGVPAAGDQPAGDGFRRFWANSIISDSVTVMDWLSVVWPTTKSSKYMNPLILVSSI